MACTSTCPDQDCPSYGACLRRKNIQASDPDAHLQTGRLERTLKEYGAARRAGIQPDAVDMGSIARAVVSTEKTGVPYQSRR